ncbi:hypothetical protein Goklo_012584 [Gossypium klotzschianum]|uniref:Uncharacterized protein n=1 Tax=Gossypium klotzschianum TaxID=34286 RepID=A0A7J8VDE7_9ROSI|nr:hypothetical protein [Gossypium klotzschianum]
MSIDSLLLLKMLCGTLIKKVSQFKHLSFPYYDQLTAIYAKDRAIGKYAKTTTDIIEE